MFRVRVICSVLMLLAGVCGWAQTGSLSNFRVSRVSFDSNQNEYAPVFRNGKLLFTSDNRDQFGVYFSSTDSLSQLTAIYSATCLNDSTFSQPEVIDNRLNRSYNSGPAWINSNEDQLFFSSNDKSKFFLVTSKRKSKLQIFVSRFEGDSWSKRKKLAFCNSAYNFTHPYLNPAEDTLYFASDCPGGFGEFDLYYSVLQNNEWSVPINMGASVNSAKNDLFPSSDGIRLVFSSNRDFGAGKLDLYSYDLTKKQLSHMGEPFNSEKDDFAYVAISKGKGYFSSNRGGNDDIYFYQELFPDFHDCEPYVKDPFCFTFFEESDDLEEGLDLEYVWSFGDGISAKGKEARHCFSGYGEYLVELNIMDSTTGKVFYNQSTYPFEIERSKRLHLEGPDTLPLSQEVIFTGENSSLEGAEIEHFYWQLDEGQLRISDTNRIALTFDKEGTHILTMGVVAKSEGSGEEQWCVTKTIMVRKGTQLPLVLDPPTIGTWETSASSSDPRYTLFLGVSDTLVHVESINNKDSLRIQPVGDSLFLYSMGVSDQKSDLLNDYRVAQEMGFSNSQVTEVKDGMLVQADRLVHTPGVELENIIDNRIKKEQIIATFDIFYEFDSYELTKVNQELIKKSLLNLQSTSNSRILISSFTDLKGKSEYNLKLSKKRSLAVRDELVKNGFPVEQIELEYYGKRVPESMAPLSDAQRRKSLIIVYEKN